MSVEDFMSNAKFVEAYKERLDMEGATTSPLKVAKTDIVTRPSHYTRWAIEPITFIMRNKMEYWRGNIIKYVSRAGAKTYDGMDEVQSEITDLRKAIRYAEMRINLLEGKESL